MTAATTEPLCPGCGRPVSECQADDVDESPAAQDRWPDGSADECPKCGFLHAYDRSCEDRASSAATTESRPTAAEVYDRLREEWDALGMMSFTGNGSGGWCADLNQEDVKQIRALLRDAAALIEGYS